MSKEEFKTSFLADKDKVNLTSADMFDRVINLKLYTEITETTDTGERKVVKDAYVVRSDFEMYFPDMMNTVTHNDTKGFRALDKCIIRKCQQKPSIKVQYKRVSLNASVEVDIFVNNFFMLDKSGNLISGFNNSTYKLTRVDFAMGYFGQFKALFSDNKPENPEQLFNFGFIDDKKTVDWSDPNVGHGITVMTMSNVHYTQMDRLPPDATLHIHGYVGNTYAPKFNTNTENFPKEYEKLMKSQAVIPAELKKGTNSYLDQVYYQLVTRNFIRKGTLPKLTSTEIAKGQEYVTGTLSDEEAKKYGVQVYLSNELNKYSDDKIEADFKRDANGNIIKSSLKIPSARTAEGKMSAIENYFGLKGYDGFTHTLLDTFGDYVVYKQSETQDIKKMLEDTTLGKRYENTALAKSWGNCIPAVYNITNDALCTIVCPFFSFINPFEKLYFKSRYALGGLVSYYANYSSANRDEFYTLWQNVSFATVENINECMIVCTGQKKR